ncbi:hypothetical protein [Nostoc sp. UHCC 0251]|uniref:hypothetical protein n=1 Tax=Nostoc sp. UHCC 0251 TaxID=3110240 RepID=UPI002B21AA32|nr:hypothetical protein [Nostoc sp. UHCC 0251]MEA5628045.1 hypothetical protein [Nostoc sp. UHCC 0251]
MNGSLSQILLPGKGVSVARHRHRQGTGIWSLGDMSQTSDRLFVAQLCNSKLNSFY